MSASSHARFESRRRRIPAGDSSLPGQTARAAGRRLRSQPAEVLDATNLRSAVRPLHHEADMSGLEGRV